MRLFVAVIFALVAATATNAHEDKYERMLHKWVKCKAMEGCFGEENMQRFKLKMKKAQATCCQKPAPELHMPIFGGESKVQLASALVNAGSVGELSQAQKDFIDAKMRQKYIASMMTEDMKAMMTDEVSPYFMNKYSMKRFTRDVEDEDEEEDVEDVLAKMTPSLLTQKMSDKLVKMQSKMQAEIGNMTCVLHEVGVLDENNELDVAAMDKCLDEGKYTAEESADGVDRTWLQKKLKGVHQMCKDLADSLPESILNACSLPNWMTKMKYFHKCAKFHKIEACMHSDIRHKIGSKGIDIADVAEKAGMAEDDVVGLSAMTYFAKGKGH